MTDDRDPALQALFAQTERPLADEMFTAAVMARVDRRRRRVRAARIALGLALAGCAWLLAPTLQAFAHLATQAVALPLIVLDDSLFAQMLAPVNNAAAATALGLVALWRLHRSIFV